MSQIVDHDTGLIIATMTPDEARGITERIRSGMNGLWALMQRAYTEQIWLSLGYVGWDEYTAAEFKGVKLALPREERLSVLKAFRDDAGMSTREIAAATGLSTGTVSESLSEKRSEMNSTSGDFVRIEPKSQIEDDDSDGTPDAVDAVSSPTEEVGAETASAPTPLVSAEGVTGETLPSRSLPATPSVEDHIAELRADGNWSVEFDKATRQIVAPVRYLAADVIERASAEDLADLDDRVARLNEWLDEVRALRPQGLRVIHGGAS